MYIPASYKSLTRQLFFNLIICFKLIQFSAAFKESSSIRTDSAKPVLKSRLKRLFDRQFYNVLRVDKPIAAGDAQYQNAQLPPSADVFEPSSVCLAKMVQNFIEDSNEKQLNQKCGRNRCNCFNSNINDSSDDDFDNSIGFPSSNSTAWCGDFSETIKDLIQCVSVAERNLLADASSIIEKNKCCKQKDDLRKILTDELLILGHDASICKSRWEKSSSSPAGEYEYIDVIVEGGERILIDIDFKSEFEVARPSGNYKTVLQSLPYIYVGKSDRLQQVVSILSEAARQSLKKKGMHVPPWRKAEYMIAKWMSPHTRATVTPPIEAAEQPEKVCSLECDCGEAELIFGGSSSSASEKFTDDGEKLTVVTSPWKLPAVKAKSCDRGGKAVVTGLASLFTEKA